MAASSPKSLSDLPIFQGMDDGDIQAVTKVIRRLVAMPGETLFRRGERSRTMFAIIDGTVEILDPAPDGRNVLLATLHSGDLMGEVALLDGGTRSASAVAVEPTTCLTLSAEGLEKLLKEHPDTAKKIMMKLAENLAIRLIRTKESVNQLANDLEQGQGRGDVSTEVRKSIWQRLLKLGD